MTQADRIREYALEHYIGPARREQLAEVKIFARDVRNALGLHPGQQTSVIQALVSKTFHDAHGLVLVERLGEGQGWQGVHYRLLGMDYSPGKGHSPRREPSAESVSGVKPGRGQPSAWLKRQISGLSTEREQASDLRERLREFPTGREQANDWRKQVLELPIEGFQELFIDYLKAKGFSNAEVEIVIRTRGRE